MIDTEAVPTSAARTAGEALVVSLGAWCTKLLLRGRATNERFVAVVRETIGTPLPSTPSSASGEDPQVLWLSPTGWLLLGSEQRLTSLAPALANRLARDGDLIDVSDEYSHVRVKGAATSDLLATCCPLDLSPAAFPPRSTARTLVAGIAAIVHRASEGSALDLYVDRSYGDYVLEALEAQTVEFR